MTPERAPEPTFDSIIYGTDQTDAALDARQILEQRLFKLRRISRIVACSAVSAALSSYCAVNQDVATEMVSASSQSNELNSAVSEVASELAGSPVYVNCDDDPLNRLDTKSPLLEEERRYIREAIVRPVLLPYGLSFYPPLTTMRENLCENIAHYDPTLPANMSDNDTAIEYANKTKDYARSIYVLLHEIEHANDISNEAKASCHAFQKLPSTLEELEVDSRYVYSTSGILAYEEGLTAMSDYLSEECKPGGAYDLDIDGTYLVKIDHAPEPPTIVSFNPRPIGPPQP